MRLAITLLSTLFLAASAISAAHLSVKLQVLEIRPGVAKFVQGNGQAPPTPFACPADAVDTDSPISDSTATSSHLTRCPDVSTSTNASFNFTWIRAYVTPTQGRTYEILMYCHRAYSYCPTPQIGVAGTAELESSIGMLDLLSPYPNPSRNPIGIKVRADAKHTAIWTIYYGRKADPPQK
jgi:hypothetical protein